MDVYERSLKLHEANRGKFKVVSKVEVKNSDDLSLAYTPGVAQACREICADEQNVYRYTDKGNMIAVISDGSAVLGLGNIGAKAAIPVMEGKAILFKEFADIDAVPLCLNTQDTEEIIRIVKALEPSFGGINLEDISAPRCFEIERRLIEEMNIPVFHDDQHGTAIVVAAGIINALKLVGKQMDSAKFVINGAGSAGISICRLLLELGAKDVVMVDLRGALCEGEQWMNDAQKEIAKRTNIRKETGDLQTIIRGKDIFIGVSAGNVLSADMVQSMNQNAIVFAMANPVPEIMPDVAKEAGARVVATGRSDFPNQINNVLVFPGIFKGALEARARKITLEMKLAAAYAIANIVSDNELSEDYIIPNVFDQRVAKAVADAVCQIVAKESHNA